MLFQSLIRLATYEVWSDPAVSRQ